MRAAQAGALARLLFSMPTGNIMDEMAEMYRRSDGRGVDRRCVNPLQAENQLLRTRIEALVQQLVEGADATARSRCERDLLREANAQLVRATFGAEDLKDAAEDVNRLQKVFLSMLAHELNNPIAAIMTANRLMMVERTLGARAQKMADIIQRQTTHLRRLVDDLLDVARISTGKVSLNTSLLAMRDVIDNAVELSTPSLQTRRQHVVIDFPPAPVVLEGDMVRLSQLFSNLLVNASKFSPPDVPVLITGRAHDNGFSVSIKDQGIGIVVEDQARIFDMFAQAGDNVEYGVPSGLGIGLALVKTIAELHGGSVHVASAGIHRGSEFTVVLPLQQGA